MAKAHLRPAASTTVKRTVAPGRRPNAELRTREHLTEARNRAAVEGGRQKPLGPSRRHHAPGCLQARPHGLRAGRPPLEPGGLQKATLHVRRVKQGTPSTHSIVSDELRALRRLQRGQERKSAFVFTSEEGPPFSTAGFARMVEQAGTAPSWPSRPTHTCCSTPAVMRWPTRDTTQGRCRAISATRTFSTRCVTLNRRRRGSRISGEAERCVGFPKGV